MKANTPKANGGDQTLKFGPKGEIDLVEKKRTTTKRIDKTTKPHFLPDAYEVSPVEAAPEATKEIKDG